MFSPRCWIYFQFQWLLSWSLRQNYYCWRVFPTSVSLWSFTWVWVTSSLLRSLLSLFTPGEFFCISVSLWSFTWVWVISRLLRLLLSLFTPGKFFTSALAYGLSLESEWHQVSSGHYYHYLLLESFLHQRQLMVFHLSLSDITSPPVTIIIIYSWRVFHISVSLWSFTWVWVTSSLLRSLLSLFTPGEFFASASAYGLSLESEWHQVSSGHYYHYLLLGSFSHQRQLIVFHWSLSDSKSPQVSRTFLSILSVLNNVVVWMVSTRLLISKSSIPYNNHLVPVPKEPIAIDIIVTFIIHISFNSQARSRY